MEESSSENALSHGQTAVQADASCRRTAALKSKSLPISRRVAELQPSRIREVAEFGMKLPGVTPLWFGESAWPTSERAVVAASRALQSGDHFYSPNSGKPELREALSDYQTRWYGKTVAQSRITVSASGMQGLVLTAQALVDVGDRVLCIEPAWPNMAECFRLAGAQIQRQGLRVVDGKWSLDMNRLLDSIDENTKVVVINSPSNPTGWVMPVADQQALLRHCRHTGTWIVCDDVYARLYRHGPIAPGFLAIADADDRLVSVNSFSKAWSMTGWRLGWITAPAALESTLAMLTEFNIAGPAGFIQQAGVTMIRDGEEEVALLAKRLQDALTLVERALSAVEGVRYVPPEGAFYCFFAVEGVRDSLALAKELVQSARVGLAPGSAFGDSGEGYLRLCYAQPLEVLEPTLAALLKSLARLRQTES